MDGFVMFICLVTAIVGMVSGLNAYGLQKQIEYLREDLEQLKYLVEANEIQDEDEVQR